MIYNETSLSGKAKVQQFSLQIIIIESYLMSVGFLQEFRKGKIWKRTCYIMQTPTSLNVSAKLKPSK